MKRTMVRIRRPLATVALSLSLLAIPGSAFAAPLEMGDSAQGWERGAICETSPQINSFEPACSGGTESKVGEYVEAPSEPPAVPTSSSDHRMWITGTLLGVLAAGIAGVGFWASHHKPRVHA